MAHSATYCDRTSLVAQDEHGHPNFEAVRRRSLLQRPALVDSVVAETPATLWPFDLLARDVGDLRPLSLMERQRADAPYPPSRQAAWLKINIKAAGGRRQ